MEALLALLPEAARTTHRPTLSELAKTFPPGHKMTDEERAGATGEASA